jgi:hypothetical protein
VDKEGDSADEITVARGLWEHVCKEMSVVNQVLDESCDGAR